jgi:hypothetical protein
MSESSDECIFCFEDISKYDVAVLNCPHKYHLHCIQKWNKTSRDFTKVCPQCNIVGEIMNIEKGPQSKPNSPLPPFDTENFHNHNQYPLDQYQTNQSNQSRLNNYNQNAMAYDQIPNARENNQNNQNTRENEINILQHHTYYDERLESRNVPLIDEHNQLILIQNNNHSAPQRRMRRQRTINDEIEHPIICCSIL